MRDFDNETMAVIQGRRGADAPTLIRLIHGVNPTGRSLPPREEARRYWLKSRLQSILVLHHGEALAFEEDSERPGLVAIWHRFHGLPACHARLSDLDDDARSYVRRRLDEEASAGAGLASPDRPFSSRAPRATPPARKDAEEVTPLEAGRAAISEFDFEAAEAAFEQGLVVDPGDRLLAEALLELLVDQLAAYARALDIFERLPSAVARTPLVREKVALAAAHLGMDQQARELLQQVDPDRRGDILIALAERALSEEQLADAGALLRQIEEYGLPEQKARLPTLARNLEECLSRAVRKDLEGLEAAQDKGDLTEAERRANAILAVWPEHSSARQALRKVAEARRQETISCHLEEARQAREQCDEAREHRALVEAIAHGERSDAIERRVRELSERQAEARVRQIVDVYRGEIVQGAVDAAMRFYVDQAPEARARIRTAHPMRMLDWLEGILAARAGVDPLRAIEAVQALAAVEEALGEGGDLDTLEATIDRHEKLLRYVSHLSEIRVKIERGRLLARRQRAMALLVEAEGLLGSGDPEGAARIMASIDERSFDAAECEKARRLSASIEAEVARRRLRRHFEQEHANGNLLGAASAAEKLAESSEDERDLWLRRSRELRDEVQRDWCVIRTTTDDDLAIFLTDAMSDVKEGAAWQVSSGWDEVVLVAAEGCWVFLGIWSLSENRLKEIVSFRAPQLMDYAFTHVDEDRVWVMSGAGHVVEIDRSQWQIRGWYEIGRALPASSIIDHSWLLPRRRTAWAEVRSAPGSEGYIHIIDLDRMASTRTLTWSGMPIHIGTAGARVVALEVHRSELALISDRGQISRRIHLPEGMSATCVVEGLMEDSMMILGYREHPTETLAHEPGLHLLVATAEGQIKKVRELQGDLDRGHELIIARAAGLVLLVYEDLESGERKLTALEPDGLGFSEAYTVEVPAPISIFSDHASQRVVVGFRRAGRLELMELSRTPPDFKGIDRAPVSNLPKFERFWFCGLGRRAEKAASRPLLAPVDASSERALRAWLDGQRASQSEPDALLAALLAAQSQDRWGACDEFRAWLFAAHGRVPSIAYEIANEAANRADWKTVEAALSGFDEEAFAASVRQHRSHILGIAALAHGRVREAVELWRQGSRHEGDCELHPYLELCGAAEPEQASGHVDSLVAAIRDADAALAAGKPREARACLSSFSALMRREIQSSARLAAAHLAMEPASASELLEARFCLARFVGLFDRDSNDTLILPPPMQTWRGKHLEDLGERARSWLDQTRSVLRERPQALI